MKTGLRQAIFEAIGEASMCWSKEPEGVFDSSRAKAIGKRLVKLIEEQAQKPTEDEFEKWLEDTTNSVDEQIKKIEKLPAKAWVSKHARMEAISSLSHVWQAYYECLVKYCSVRKPAPVGLVEELNKRVNTWLATADEGQKYVLKRIKCILSRYTPESKETRVYVDGDLTPTRVEKIVDRFAKKNTSREVMSHPGDIVSKDQASMDVGATFVKEEKDISQSFL